MSKDLTYCSGACERAAAKRNRMCSRIFEKESDGLYETHQKKYTLLIGNKR